MQLSNYLAIKKNQTRRLTTNIARKAEPNHKRVVVSLTSYPERIRFVPQVIRSMFAQTVLPDLTVLYLSMKQFPNTEDDLPQELLKLRGFDFRIRWVEDDYKSHKKYLYSVKDYPDAVIITLDDDIKYRNTLIEELLLSYRRFPNCISAIRTHAITFDQKGIICPYSNWLMENAINMPELCDKPSVQLFATSGAGMLLPPHCLPEMAFDTNAIAQTCPHADDIWLKSMSALAGIKTVAVKGWAGVDCIENSQETSLWSTNRTGGNDKAITNLRVFLSHKSINLDKLLFDPELNKFISRNL